MATSPVYGWPEPADTDFVKDGALAMRDLGNSTLSQQMTQILMGVF
jgi:hypothetical protein